MSDFKIGDTVRCGVYVGHEFRPTYLGRIVQLHSGYATVDICPTGNPWHVAYTYSELRHEKEQP
jgi:hypothetical protein